MHLSYVGTRITNRTAEVIGDNVIFTYTDIFGLEARWLAHRTSSLGSRGGLDIDLGETTDRYNFK